jgi:ribonucleoside-triphosphate reductase
MLEDINCLSEKANTEKIIKIDEQIKALETQLENVEGSKTEVYTRIVGYHRDITSWNKGKKEEYKDRQSFDLSSADSENKVISVSEETENPEQFSETPFLSKISHYVLFYSPNCPNCPSAKAFVKDLGFEGQMVDVSTEEGFNLANKYNIFSVPSIVLFDADNSIIKICCSLNELKLLLKNKALLDNSLVV